MSYKEEDQKMPKLRKRKRTSIIWTIDKNKLQKIFDKSNSIVEVLKSLGFSGYAGNHRTIKERIKVGDISLLKFNQNKTKYRKDFMSKLTIKNKLPISKALVINSSYDRKSLKKKD